MLTEAAPVEDICEEKVMNKFAQILTSHFQELLLSKLQGMLLSVQKHCEETSVVKHAEPSDGSTEPYDGNTNINNDVCVAIEGKQPIHSHNDILNMATASFDDKYFDNSCNNQ